MRPAETEYWDKQARAQRDNVWKRRALAERIFRHTWINERVLEIGVGLATIAAALKVIHVGNLKYIGTDVSKVYCEDAKGKFGLNVVNTDVLGLPTIEGGFTRVIALDSLEHVKLEDREEGYKAIGDRLADEAIMFINIPLNPSYHDDEFDHKFDFDDITSICNLADMRIKLYEEYFVDGPSGRLFYGWTVLEKGKF